MSEARGSKSSRRPDTLIARRPFAINFYSPESRYREATGWPSSNAARDLSRLSSQVLVYHFQQLFIAWMQWHADRIWPLGGYALFGAIATRGYGYYVP
jgi:hypothetical protein